MLQEQLKCERVARERERKDGLLVEETCLPGPQGAPSSDPRQPAAAQQGAENAAALQQTPTRHHAPSPFSRHLTRTASRQLVGDDDERERMDVEEESMLQRLTRERDQAQAELAAYVLEEVARRRQEEQHANMQAGEQETAHGHDRQGHVGNSDVHVRLAVCSSRPVGVGVSKCRVHGIVQIQGLHRNPAIFFCIRVECMAAEARLLSFRGKRCLPLMM